MAAMGNYLEGQIIKYWLQNDATAVAKPATVYVALYTAATTDVSASGTEVTGAGYARVAVTNNATNWAGPTDNDGTVTNGAAITFGAPTANWGDIGWVAIKTASTGGETLFHGALSAVKTVNNGDPAFSFPIGAISIQID